MMRTSGDLVKSATRFTLAMSLFTAREAAAVVTEAGRQTGTLASSMNQVARTAGSQLAGPMKTAFAVGENVQTGMVDFVFDSLGQGVRPARVASAAEARGLAVPMMTGGRRRVEGVRTVSSGAVNRPVPQQELVDTLTAYQADAAHGQADLHKIVVGLWKSEGFSTTVGKYRQPENSFADPRLPAAALPIAHVGFGSGTTEHVVFDKDELDAVYGAHTHERYRAFSYEGIGAILRIYEPGFFKVMSGALGLVRLDAPPPPDPAGFYAAYLGRFPTEIQRLIAHGYGRIIAFSNMNIYRALEEITTLPAGRVEPAAHGAGFAFAIMNSADLPRLLEYSAVPFDAVTRAAFQSGLVYSLVFFEWYVPGLLAAWQPTKGQLERELVELARQEAARAVERGYPLAFRLENPRT
jgi:hypothetical protein